MTHPAARRSLPSATTFLLFLPLLLLSSARAQQVDPGTHHYYGIEIGGVLCGYAEITLTPGTHDGRPVTVLDEEVFAMMTALGSTFNTRQTLRYRIDDETGNFLWHENEVEQGDTHMGATYVVHDGAAFLTSLDEDEETRIELPPGTVRPNTVLFPQLLAAFENPAVKEWETQVLQVRDGEVQDFVYTRLDAATLELGGRTWDVLAVEEMNRKTGLKIVLWIDRATGQMLQADVLNRRIFRSDASVVKRVRVADMNSSILLKTNERIGDIQGITAMKVRARLAPIGIWVTEDGLNGPGQSFTGSVDENAIEGVFEIRHARYDGANAPPFPPDFHGDASLQEYLAPSTFCESDAPELIAEARRITAGAPDAWEAARRLSAWVSENISYAIPGGGSARKTYEVRAGECGAHSLLLAAFCRAVGIPARVVWGCMYTPNLGGSFGQHGWNEIYMGDAGWVPVDATAQETEFVDSGHLRIGEMRSTSIALNAQEFEILDYRLGSGVQDASAAALLAPYLGSYTSDAVRGKLFKVIEQNGKLGVDIPDKMVLMFNEPGEDGLWPCQLSPKLKLGFERDGSDVMALRLMEENRMPRKDAEIEASGDVPEQYRPLLGVFVLQGLNADFTIIWETGRLCLQEPRGAIYPLTFREDAGCWEADDGSRRVAFEQKDGGAATAILATHITKLDRQSDAE